MIRRRPSSTRGGPRPLPRRPSPRNRPNPWRDRLGWIVGLTVLGLGLFWLLRSVFAVLFASAVIAYLLDPLVDRLEARGWPRERGIALLFFGGALTLLLVLLVLLPSIAREFQDLGQNVGGYLEQARTGLAGLREEAEARLGRPIPISGEEILAELQAGDGEAGELGRLVQEAAPNVGKWATKALSSALTGGFNIVVTALNLALMPIFTFYLLRDWDRMIAAIAAMVPLRYRGQVGEMAERIDERLSSFVRGQTTVCLVLGLLYSFGLLLSGIDLAIVVGMGSGLLFIVPYLGTIVGVLLASALALLKFGLDWHLLAVWATYGGVQALEGFFLTPLIVGDKVGLHPLVVMIALLVGGNLFGIWGMLLAIPVTAASAILLLEWLRHYRESRFYASGGEG